VRFAKETVTIIVGKGVFVKHRLRLSLDRVFDRIEIGRFPKDRIFDNSPVIRLPRVSIRTTGVSNVRQ